MAKAADAVKALQKAHGDRAVTFGVTTYEAERIPFGVFELDYMTGGGIPRGTLTEIFGAESGGKTNMSILAMVQAQRMFPDDFAVFIDAEHATDRKWMQRLGVNMDKLIYVRPAFGEQIIEAIERFVAAEDVSIVVVDSTAAITGMGELEADADKTTPGNATQLIQRLIKRMIAAQGTATEEWEAGNRGMPPAVIMINQVRQKIGVMFGSPESTPGGNMLKHAAALRLRVYGKNVVDKKVNSALPVRKNMAVTAVKWKVPIVAMASEFEMAVLKHNGFREGEVDSWNTVEKLLKHHGMLEKDAKNKGWWLNMEGKPTDGFLFPTLLEIRKRYREEFDLRTEIHKELAIAAKNEVEGETVTDADGTKYNATTGEVEE